MNWAKHVPGASGADPCSSAAWFDGWKDGFSRGPPDADAPVVPPSTWLAATGWRRLGLIDVHETPRQSLKTR
jgi:hypothetical protein